MISIIILLDIVNFFILKRERERDRQREAIQFMQLSCKEWYKRHSSNNSVQNEEM